jgi:hypothetical protein
MPLLIDQMIERNGAGVTYVYRVRERRTRGRLEWPEQLEWVEQEV